MNKLAAFLYGVMNKEAGGKGLITIPASMAGNDLLWAGLLGLPIIAGAGAGALASKASSPVSSARTAQKELVLAEMQEALAELKRRKAIAEKEQSNKVTSFNERPLHL